MKISKFLLSRIVASCFTGCKESNTSKNNANSNILVEDSVSTNNLHYDSIKTDTEKTKYH